MEAEREAAGGRGLVARALAGEQEAVAELYDRYFDRVYDFARRLTRDHDAAAEVVQDTFMKAVGALGSLKRGERFRAWLFSIAYNTALGRIERRQPEAPPEHVGAGGEDEESFIYGQIGIDRRGVPRGVVEDQELVSLVWQAASDLEPRQYALVDLHLRQGLADGEIARVVGVSKANAHSEVSRLKESLEETLAPHIMRRRGKNECAALNELLGDMPVGAMNPETRGLVAEHINDCPTCQGNKKKLVSALSVFSAMALVPPPRGLREDIWGRVAEAGVAPLPRVATEAPSTRGAVRTVSRTGWRRLRWRLPQGAPNMLAIGGGIGIGGGIIVGLLALFGAFSDDGGPSSVVLLPTDTATSTATTSPTATSTASPTPTPSPSPTPSPTPTPTPTATTTATPTTPTAVPTPWDLDGDGLVGPNDGCPQQAEDFDDFEDDDGCPEAGPFTPTVTPSPSPAATLPPPAPSPDTEGPNMGIVQQSSDLIWDSDRCSPDEVSIGASVSDSSGVAAVVLHYRVVHGSSYLVGWRAIEMQHLGGGTYRATVDPPTFRSEGDGAIEYYVEAEDEQGNTSQSGSPSSPYSVAVKRCSG